MSVRDDDVGREAELRLHHCGAGVVVGLDRDVAAVAATVDPDPVSLEVEQAAAAAGRRSYALRFGRHRRRRVDYLILEVRDSFDVGQTGPDERDRFNIVVDHICGAALPAARPVTARPKPAAAGDDPPF